MRCFHLRVLGLLCSLALPAVAVANDAVSSACHGFKWDISDVVTLYAGAAQRLEAGADAATAPEISAGHVYALDLVAQERTRFAAPVGKVMLADGAYAGLLRFTPATSGLWVVSLDRGAWIDVVTDGKRVESVDFSGSEGCAAPRKVVLYRLDAGVPYIVQLSAANAATLRTAITPGPATTP